MELSTSRIHGSNVVWGRPDLLKRDGIHPSSGGAALLSRNLAHSLRVHT